MGAGVIVPVLAGVVAIVTLTVTSDDAAAPPTDRPPLPTARPTPS